MAREGWAFMTTGQATSLVHAYVATGIEGLDDVLHGGLVPHWTYLVEGDPGAGKTTLALQFMLTGVRNGQRCLYVTLSESEAELRLSARSHGWDLDGITILDLIASEEALKPDTAYTMYHPSEVELGETTKAILAEAARIKPARVVLDSLSELRLLAENPLRYRRQILALKHHLGRQDCTVLLIDDRIGGERDMHLHSLAHGVIGLDRETPLYGTMRRRLEITKMRARPFREGYHDYIIQRGGLRVFPRLIAAEHGESFLHESAGSGLAPLDALLGGGLPRGTSTLVIGAAGTGKTSLATQFAWTSAQRGENVAMFLFDESPDTFRVRSAGLRMDPEPLIRSRKLLVRRVDPAELSPGEFTHCVRRAVEEDACRMVVIDSLNGYMNSMPSERFLTLHLHELLGYLGNRGVVTLLLLTQHGFLGSATEVPVDASYLADTVIMLRYFERLAEVRQAISVIKKRTGNHERSIREMRFDAGIQIGEPVRDVHGVLAGRSQLVGRGRGSDGNEAVHP
jgi:circadian clock protein KaiC